MHEFDESAWHLQQISVPSFRSRRTDEAPRINRRRDVSAQRSVPHGRMVKPVDDRQQERALLVPRPLMLLSAPECGLPEWVVSTAHPYYAIAFTDSEKAPAFVEAHGPHAAQFHGFGTLDFEILTRSFIERQLQGVCVDPNPDGHGGLIIDSHELLTRSSD